MTKYKVDLHIHTPASKCYKGAKDDSEYFEILKSANEQNLDIIAITDHNTIAGYERFMQLKQEVYEKIHFLEMYQNESYRMKEEYDDMVMKKSLFDSILILPGVEITVNPGVHILIIGNVTDVGLLSDLLTEVGYSDAKRGSDSDYEIDVDIVSLLKNTKLNGLIVSAPHIDSKNGIFNEMDGHYRSSVMKNSVITSFSVNSDRQKENVIRMLSSDPEYKRDRMPAFINCSDAHESSAVGNKYSFFELEEKTYSDLFLLFSSPEGRVSDTDDSSLVKMIGKVIENSNAVLMGNSDRNAEEIAKCLCAALNEEVDLLIFGTDKSFGLIGVNNDEGCFRDKLNVAFDLISSAAMSLGYSMNFYKLGNGKYVCILTLKQSEKCVWYLKDNEKVYHLNDDEPEISSIEDIERIVYKKTINDLLQIEKKDEERLKQANIQLNSIKNRVDKLDTAKCIVRGSFPILHYCDLTVGEGSKLSEDDKNRISENGSSGGNVNYIFKNSIRLNDAILRFTCPRALLADDILEKVDKYPVKGNSIIIVRGGGMHYIPDDGQVFGVDADFLVLTPKDNKDFDMKLLLAWMKSSLFTWYLCRRLESTDLYLPIILTKAIFPLEKIKNSELLVDSVDSIIKKERDFLDNYNELCGKCESNCLDCSDSCLIRDIVIQHNRAIDVVMKKIDECFFKDFEIEVEDIQWISADLKAEGIYDNLSNIGMLEEE